MQRLKDLCSSALAAGLASAARLRDRSPSVCFLIAAVLAASVAVSIGVSSAKARQAPSDLVAAVRHELANLATADSVSAIASKVDSIDSSVDALVESVGKQGTAIEQLQASVDSLKPGGRRTRSTSAASHGCVKLPSGFDCDVGTLTEAAKGVNVLGTGETYSAALVRHGFQASEVGQLDEETCRKIYDGWRSLYPPESFRYGSGTNSGRWTCTGGRCYRNY
jgi:hypothetical protein